MSACGLILLLSIVIVYSWLNQPEGIPAETDDPFQIKLDPLQDNSSNPPMPVLHFGKKMIILSAKAAYQIDGVLISKKRYYRGFMNDLSPYDFALAWGDVPDMRDEVEFSQVIRYCLFKLKSGSSIDPGYIQNHMSNNHLIPANKNIRRAMAKAKHDDKIRIQGHLVDVEASQNGHLLSTWRSSDRRDDTGNGACEIIYVKSLRINNMVYR